MSPTAYCQGPCRLVGLPRCRPLAIRGVAGWSAYRARSIRSPVARWRGCLKLVDPLRLLCHAIGPLPVSRLLLGALRTMSRLPAGFTEVISAPDILSDLETIQHG
ncbi:hypothetical protein GW17_00048041 [Ensete ventricosum]|nr:hypothetical protein GW17_00048041 [Ensete ventricosum]